MTDKEIARPLELELQELFGEDSYQLERKPCTGKYCGHWDYTLVFGSGRRLYIGLDQRNYLNCTIICGPSATSGHTRKRTANGSAPYSRLVTLPFAARRWRLCPMMTR